MGGPGSGNFYRYGTKTTVEQCVTLSVNRMVQDGAITPEHVKRGTWAWYRGEERTNSVGYQVDTQADRGMLTLDYQVRGEAVRYSVPLVTTRPHFGGVRWWYVCPLVVNGQACGRRVGKLYLPPGGRYFGCRHCYDLTYRSSQQSDKRVSALRRLPVDELLSRVHEMVEGGNPTELILALKALPLDEF